MSERVDVAVIGGGPAGLAAASELMALGAGSVLVVERETDAGGIPRHCGHQGFGARDMHRLMSGPRYAARWARTAERAGAQLVLGTQVTGWAGPGTLQLTGPGGRRELQAQAVVLATGCRERPRSARLIPGSRPMRGVMNTGTLQQLVHGAHERVGSRAVVVGAEHVSFSALMTLRHGGARAIAMTTELPRHQSFAAVRAGAGVLHRTRLLTSTSLSDIRGDERLRSVQVTDLASGKSETISCDVLVLSADWIPEHELAVLAGAELDRGTMGPSVDRLGRTSTRGLFAAGNVLHGAEPADFAALSGRRVARSVIAYLAGDIWPAAAIPVGCSAPLSWVSPNRITAGDSSGRSRCLLRASQEITDARVAVRQDGRLIASSRVARVGPGRSAHVRGSWSALVDPAGGPVEVSLVSGRGRR